MLMSSSYGHLTFSKYRNSMFQKCYRTLQNFYRIEKRYGGDGGDRGVYISYRFLRKNTNYQYKSTHNSTHKLLSV